MLKREDTILVDTCSLIELMNWSSCKFVFSHVRCLILPETYKELFNVAPKELKLLKSLNNISFETLEITTEIRHKAKELYKQYGLIKGLSYVDCLYLASAKINNIPLMSCDRILLKVAEKEGVRTIPMFLHERLSKQTISIVISKVTCGNVSFKDSAEMVTEGEIADNTEVIAE